MQVIQLKLRAWGCKIKSKIQAELILDADELKQGELLALKLIINFDPEDLPSSLEITQEQSPQNLSFVLKSPIEIKSLEPRLELDIAIEYSGGPTGDYRLESSFRHAEFGTELVEIQPLLFHLTTPKVDITYCRPDVQRVSKGQTFEITVGIDSPSPQKLRGIVFGRLISDDDMVHKMYELGPKRISVLGDKDMAWHLRVPQDETKTGKFKAIIEFKSKDTFSKKEFDDFLELRQARLIRVNELKSASEMISKDDTLELAAELENIGLNEVELEVYPEIIKSTQAGAFESKEEKEDKKKIIDSAEKVETEIKEDAKTTTTPGWKLDVKAIKLSPDAVQALSWSWKVPEDAALGKYEITLHWKYQATGTKASFLREVFQIRKTHELKIKNAVATADSFSPGSEAHVKIILFDAGTRVGEELNIDCSVYDIFNHEVYKSSNKIVINDQATEYDFIWPIPSDLEGDKYDLQVLLWLKDEFLLKRKFSKIFNIELPIRLDLQLILPKQPSLNLEVAQLLLENEKITRKIEYKSLTFYKLNSNTHLFLLNNELINYSLKKKSTPKELQLFSEILFSYLVIRGHLTRTHLDDDITFWSRLGFCWANLLFDDRKILNEKKVKSAKDSVAAKLTSSTWESFSQNIFKNSLVTKNKRPFQLSEIFNGNILKNKEITSTDDFKLIISFLRFFSEFTHTVSSTNKEAIKHSDLKVSTNNVKLLNELNNIFQAGAKYRKVMNSKLLQKRFNKTLSKWLSGLKSGRISRHPNETTFQVLVTANSYLLLYLVSEIIKILKSIKREKYAPPSKFSRLILYEMVYNFVLINYNVIRVKFAPDHRSTDSQVATEEFNRSIGEIKKSAKKFWFFHMRWQAKYCNYLKNMVNRSNLTFVHEHVKITTNPVILHGMRGGKINGKIILGNNGERVVVLHPYLALPSIHWSLIEPEAHMQNNLYNLKPMNIPPKQTKEMPMTIAFPDTLSFPNYTAILKLNAKPFELLSENF